MLFVALEHQSNRVDEVGCIWGPGAVRTIDGIVKTFSKSENAMVGAAREVVL
jgi:hypothetical protein